MKYIYFWLAAICSVSGVNAQFIGRITGEMVSKEKVAGRYDMYLTPVAFITIPRLSR